MISFEDDEVFTGCLVCSNEPDGKDGLCARHRRIRKMLKAERSASNAPNDKSN